MNGMPLAVTLGNMASTMGVPMQLNSPKMSLLARKPSTLATARFTS